MEKQINSPRFLRQRKFYTILPLLVLPFITFMFWALGGGKSSIAAANKLSQKGFNMQLPDAYLKEDKPVNKLDYYEKAETDSARLQEQMKNDPYYTFKQTDADKANEGISNKTVSYSHINSSPHDGSFYQDPNEAKVYQKLEQLNKILNQPPAVQKQSEDDKKLKQHQNTAGINSDDIDKLEQMMTYMNQDGSEDPEMQQLNGVLDKILDIQHPQRIQEKLKQLSEKTKGHVFQVSAKAEDSSVSLLSSDKSVPDTVSTSSIQTNSFFSINDEKPFKEAPNAVEAVIPETQTVMNGSTVKLRLLHPVYINGIKILQNQFLYGTALLTNERLTININSIQHENSIFPVNLAVYDLDGISGIYIPEAVSIDAGKESADRTIQSIGLTGLNPSLGAQAANAGIDAARNLFSRKIKQVKVTLKAGYRVLLLDQNLKTDN